MTSSAKQKLLRLARIKQFLKAGLTSEYHKIYTHLSAGNRSDRPRGTERIFGKSFESQLKDYELSTQKSLKILGWKNFYPKRTSGYVDLYISSPETAFEYKAVRLPRTLSSAHYDIGQLEADYLRLRKNKMEAGFLIVFVYGPLVPNMSEGALYQACHNQFFIDFKISTLTSPESVAKLMYKNLGLDRAWPQKKVRPGAIVTTFKDFGAICFDCRRITSR